MDNTSFIRMKLTAIRAEIQVRKERHQEEIKEMEESERLIDTELASSYAGFTVGDTITCRYYPGGVRVKSIRLSYGETYCGEAIVPHSGEVIQIYSHEDWVSRRRAVLSHLQGGEA